MHARTSEGILLRPEQEADLFRIAQEALNNVQRHAHAREVEIDLRHTAGKVRLSIRDDGIGFDPAAVAAGRHGILGMKERAKLQHGRLWIRSMPGAGSTISVSVPAQSGGDA